jgi:hypothetical protein
MSEIIVISQVLLDQHGADTTIWNTVDLESQKISIISSAASDAVLS